MKITLLALLLSVLCVSANPEIEENWETTSAQIYSNSSSYQFYASFVLIKGLLESDWNDELFDQIQINLGLDMLGTKAFSEKFKDDKIWGIWFQKKTNFQNKILEQLQPMVEKKQKGDSLTEKEIKLLSTLEGQINEVLLNVRSR